MPRYLSLRLAWSLGTSLVRERLKTALLLTKRSCRNNKSLPLGGKVPNKVRRMRGIRFLFAPEGKANH